MSFALIHGYRDPFNEVKWGPVIGLSFVLHMALMSLVFFVPSYGPSIRSFPGTVYSVDLVEMPGGGAPKTAGPALPREARPDPAAQKDTKAKRIEEPRREEKPLVIAKKTVEKTAQPVEKPKASTSEMIEKAISSIEKKAKSDNVDHLNAAFSKLQSKVGSGEGQGSGGGPGGAGQGVGGGGPMALYQMEVEAKIRSNWAYPVALDKKQLEAVVVILVKQDGTILKTRIEKRSASLLFDESVLKAIERSNPLPPFPDSYRVSQDEIVLTFNLKDLEGR
jgi:colicin import membrane protein